ncbi:glycoside hydrolase superfamily [Aspergillus pseudocaelatus]|uniref:Glycoside hydrolase superfamily n=1 Tax=Aspergillus pseudocaelatus TaxID=1825620 RepID=A0ABQ6WBY3_9EURO|nr:glycoside hydrolase superfamily [Aspergillus pseudocaelatus]
MVFWWSLLCILHVLGPAFAATPAEWRFQSIYFLLTARLARTDGSTTAFYNTEDRKYCGGTWQGIIDKLEYIQGMGFTAIWITPVTGQLPQHTVYGDAYHGYWQQDIYTLNSNYGAIDGLKALASTLYNRGMYLMVDIVANHMGYDGAGNPVNYSIFKLFSSKDYFHNFCLIQNFNDQTQSENCWLGDNRVSLPDLNTTREDVKGLWYKWVEALVSNYSIDGLRVDTVKHVQKDFWRGYNQAAGIYCIGEVFNGDPIYTCPYQDIMDGVLKYPM